MSNTVRNQQHESLFKSWNLTYRLIEEVNIESIVRQDDAQVRDIAHIALIENVEQYALQMQAGAEFPPVIIWAGVNVLIDGNTRLAAAKRIGRAIFPAYEVELPDIKMARILAAAINNTGSQRLTPLEARRAALNAMDLQFSDAQIAMLLGITAESARQWRRLSEVGKRAERTGVAELVDSMPKTMRMELGKITHDQPFRELAQAIADTKPDVKDVRQVIEQVKGATSDEAATAVVAAARQEWTPIGPAPAKHRPNRTAQQARMHIGGLLKCEPTELVDPAKKDTDLARWRDLARLADRVIGMLETEAAA